MGAWWLTVVVGAAVTGYAEGSDGEQYIDPTWAQVSHNPNVHSMFVSDRLVVRLLQWLVICCLLLLGGVFSGLSLGLMQLDPNRLRIVSPITRGHPLNDLGPDDPICRLSSRVRESTDCAAYAAMIDSQHADMPSLLFGPTPLPGSGD